MAIYGRYGIDKEGHKLQILEGCATRFEEIYTCICSERPVVVLTRAVDALEWLLVQQYTEVVACSNLAHNGHQQLIVVVCEVCLLVYWCQLELVWCNLVVASLQRNTELQTLILQVTHKGEYSLRNSTEVVVVELLILRRLVTHKGATCLHKVGACRPESIINQEVLLLPAEEYLYSLDTAVEVFAHLGCSIRYCGNRTEQRGLVVQCLARVRYKYGRDAECRIYDKCWRCRVPRRVTSCLEGVADTATRERRSVRLLLYEHLARELFQHSSRAVRLRERIVLLGCSACKWLKPMAIVVCTILQCPLTHTCCYRIGNICREWGIVLDGVEQRLVNLLVEILAHLRTTENHNSEVIRWVLCWGFHLYGLVVESLLEHLKS